MQIAMRINFFAYDTANEDVLLSPAIFFLSFLFICVTRRNFYIFYCMRLAYVRLSHFFRLSFSLFFHLIIILLALLLCLFVCLLLRVFFFWCHAIVCSPFRISYIQSNMHTQNRAAQCIQVQCSLLRPFVSGFIDKIVYIVSKHCIIYNPGPEKSTHLYCTIVGTKLKMICFAFQSKRKSKSPKSRIFSEIEIFFNFIFSTQGNCA